MTGRGPGARAAAGLAAVGLALLLAAPASAQTSVKLVGNSGQTENTSATTTRFINDRAQAFTTGSNPIGYTLKRVDLPMSFNGITNPVPPTYTVKIHSASAAGPGSDVVGTLTNPTSVIEGANSFTTAGIDLDPGTTYFLVIDASGEAGNHHRIHNDITDSDNEDSGAAAGWSIADNTFDRAFDSGGGWTSRTYSWQIAIHGVVRNPAPPGVPAAPTLSTTEGTSLTVTWTAPTAGFAPVTGYDVRYRRKGDTAWTDHPHEGTALTATITGLLQGASWEAQVSARNTGGPGRWSATGAGHTGPARFVRAETRTDGGRVIVYFSKDIAGSGGGFSAGVGGVNRPAVGGSSASGNEVSFAWSSNSADHVQAGQTVTVSYAKPSGQKLTDDDGLEVASFTNKPVTNTVPAAPAAPVAPTVASVSDNPNALSVRWTAPAANNSAITDYDLRYFAGSADPSDDDDWIEAGETGGHDHVGTATTATITGLTASTAYRVQVRAQNAQGESAWSAAGSATTSTTPPGAPAAPTVTAVSSSRNLSVSWTAPSVGGSAVTGYELRLYAGSADPTDAADWVLRNESSGIPDLKTNTATTAALTGLAASTAYRVQVRATNALVWGPWSPSGTATTNSTTSTTNRAPIRLKLGTPAQGCIEKTEDTAHEVITAAFATLVSVRRVLSRDLCGSVSSRNSAMFSDPDGDTLTVTARVRNLPDNVRLGDDIPFVNLGTVDKVFFYALAAYRQTDVNVDVTATDPHGAAVSTFVTFTIAPMPNNNGAPRFDAQAASVNFAKNEAIEPVVLPAAVGGDVRKVDTNGDIRFPYTYEVTGLPPGLDFDAATRTLSGTPTRAGTFTVTYTAGDADSVQDQSDEASQTFRVHVPGGPQIDLVRIVSHPTYDADGDGAPDTYVRGDSILVDVEFNAPVKVTTVTDGGELRLRLDLGTDNAALNDGSRQVLDLDSVLYGNHALRFAYKVLAADTDTDGVWVQKDAAGQNKVLFPNGVTVTHAVTGEAADLTASWLPTTGNPRAKVDGSKTSADIGPRPTGATVDGDTLEVTFDGNLDTSVDTGELVYRFAVRGAGGLGADDRGDQQSPSAVSVSGATLTLTLGTPARAGDTVTLTYTYNNKDTDDVLEDTSGKRAPRFRDLAVTNNTSGTAGPALLSASVAGKKLEMVFDAELDTGSTPAGSAFTVEADDLDGDSREIAGTGTVAIADTVVTVTLAEAMRADELGAVSYEKPTSSPLRGSGSGNPEVRSFDRFRIAEVTDGVAPALLGGAVAQTGTSPAKSKLSLYFDEALDTSSVPAAGDFAVQVGENAATVSAVAVEDTAVVLTLDRLAAAGTLFEVTWTPGTHRIRDLAGNAAAGFRQTVGAASGKPVLQSAKVDGARAVLTWDKALDPASAPAADAFTFHLELLTSGGLNQQIDGDPGDPVTSPDVLAFGVSRVAVEGRTAVVHLQDPVLPCEAAFEVTYEKPASSPFQGLDGTEADGFASQAVTNARAYRCNNPNWLQGARVGSVILRAGRPYATDVEPQAAWFEVAASGGPVTVTGAAYSADDPHELKLTLSRDIAPGETVTVSYRRPGGESGLWDVDGKQLADIVDRPVANAAAAPLTAAFHDVPAAHDGPGSAFSFELAFSENFGGRLDYRMLRDEALQATNARVTEAKRAAQGQNRRWVVTVRPRSSDDVTVSLGATTDCSAPAAICTPDGRRLSNSPSATVAGRSNRPATGAPAITGEARVGETLTASTADVEDADGLSDAAFAFQWVSGDADVAGATEASYTLAEADEGSAISVRVTFTDDAGHAETLTSAATAAVAPRLPPLTAAFEGVPAEHDGRGREFSFALVFSEDFPGRLNYNVLKDEALQATNARVTGAKRAGGGRNQRWVITVRPRSMEDVTVSLPATTDCGAAGAVCTETGRPLSSSNAATVAGPAGISVADARVEEGAGAMLAFAVALSRAATRTVTVDYATADGSARAGADYRAASGTLTFEAGESAKTVEVAVLDDSHDEGEETLTLRLSNASGGQVTDGEATGTIENADLMPAALLARFGRATAEQVVSVVEERMAAPRDRGFRARFAGRELQSGQERDFALGFLSQFAQPLGMGMGPAGAAPPAMGAYPAGAGALGAGTAGMGCATGRAAAAGMTGATGGGAPLSMGAGAAGAFGAGTAGMGCALGAAGMGSTGGAMGMGGMPGAMGMPGQQASMGGAHGGGLFDSLGMGGDLLSNSELELNRESRGGILSVWSRSSRSHFSGIEDALSLNGDVRTTMFGADYSRGALTLGLSVGRTLGTGGYSGPSGGQMTTAMTGFYPWVGYQVNDRVSVWGVTGYGTGSLSLTPDGQSALETGVSLAMSAVGTRGELIGSRATGGFALAFKADALMVTAASDLLDSAAGRLNASEAGVTRVRTALEGSRGFTLGGGRLSLTPSVEVGLRRDGGDAETGAGMDVGGGLAFTDAVTGLSLDVRVRTLVVHQAEGFTDRGMSLSLGWDPTPSSPLGLSARVAPSWGGSAQGGAEALWGNQMAYGMGSHQMHGAGGQLAAEVGYGLPVGARFVGTPRVGLTTSEYGRDYQVGYGLGVLEQGRVHFELGVEAQRRESPTEGGTSNGFLGRATLGW